jgi:Leucine-rich repeat (LRR) protein
MVSKNFCFIFRSWLRVLDLSPFSTQVNNWTALFLRHLTSLQSLKLTECTQLSSFWFASAVVSLRNLTFLDISYCSLSNISIISVLTKLKGLDVTWHNESDFSFLTKLIHLEYLNLQYCRNVQSIVWISQLTSLQSLHLVHCHFLDNYDSENCDSISYLNNLKTLIIVPSRPLPLYKQNLYYLRSLTQLEHLTLPDFSINDDLFRRYIVPLTSLTHLNVSQAGITRTTRDISKLTKLKTLILSWNSLQLSFLSKLSSLIHLESLVLSYCLSITDRTLHSVSFPSSLQYLNLENCPVSDSGVNELFKLPNLRKVHLVGTSVSFSKLQELAKKCGSEVCLPKW